MPEPPTFRGTPNVTNMKTWLHHLGHSDADLNRLNVIHVAGTKGKGSTCALVASFLKSHALRTGYSQKIGLFTSPHLKVVEERIQINSLPVTKTLFAKYVFEVWDRLISQDAQDVMTPRPRYMQLLMLLAVHIFVREGTDVVVCETNKGGEWDVTNFWTHPTVTGITDIGIDHVRRLGPTIENIAWHKSGIFKSGALAFSVQQERRVGEVLRRRALEKGVVLEFVDDEIGDGSDVPALRTGVQRRNAALAYRLANAFLAQKSRDLLMREDIRLGAENLNWEGRFQQIVHDKQRWCLDGAHNEMGVPYAARWFADIVAEDLRPVPRVLIFSHISERDGAAMLRIIAKTLLENDVSIDLLLLSTYEERRDGTRDLERCIDPIDRPFDVETQKRYTQAWRAYQPDTKVSVEMTVEGALELARDTDCGGGMQTLVTGSLYLVGSALRLLDAV